MGPRRVGRRRVLGRGPDHDYYDYKWKNNKGGYVYVYFENGRVTYKSWYS